MAIVRDGKLFGRYHYAFVIMVCCCLVQAFGMGLILNCGSLFYVPVCTDLGFSRSEISTYMTGYFIGTTLVTPLAGKLLSKYDTRIVMSVAIVVLSGAVASMSLFHEIWQWQVSGFFRRRGGIVHFRAAVGFLHWELVHQTARFRVRDRHGVFQHIGRHLLAGPQFHDPVRRLALRVPVRGRRFVGGHSPLQPDNEEAAVRPGIEPVWPCPGRRRRRRRAVHAGRVRQGRRRVRCLLVPVRVRGNRLVHPRGHRTAYARLHRVHRVHGVVRRLGGVCGIAGVDARQVRHGLAQRQDRRPAHHPCGAGSHCRGHRGVHRVPPSCAPPPSCLRFCSGCRTPSCR